MLYDNTYWIEKEFKNIEKRKKMSMLEQSGKYFILLSHMDGCVCVILGSSIS